MKRRLLCLCMALLLTAQLVLPAAAETAAAETTEPAVTETTVPEETTAPTEETTAPTEETTAPTEETTAPTEETTAPTEETTAPTEETEAPTEQTEEDEEDDSAAPLADAEGTEIADASQTCGENLTWTLEDGTLTISGTGAMTDYDRSNQAPWQGQTIQSLILNEGITSIGAHAFEFVNLQNQGTLQLPGSLQSIGEYAFFGCNLSALTIGANLTGIGTEALSCNFWNQITVSNDNTALAFQNGALYAQNMTRIVAVLSTLDSVFTLPETVATIDDSVFLNVSGVQELQLNSSFHGFSSGAIGFSVCPSLESITVPGDSAALSSKDGVLFSADGKTLLTYPMAKQDTTYEIPAGTERIANYAIDNNINLRELVIPEGVTDLGEWNFRYCQALKKVTLPSTVQIIRDKSIGYLYDSKVDGFIIRGVPGSAAETYATANGFTFEVIGETGSDTQGGICGDNLTWTLEDGTLTISGTGAMYEYDWAAAPWFGLEYQRLILEEGITSISQGVFQNIEQDTGVLTLPDSLRRIGSLAFSGFGWSDITLNIGAGLSDVAEDAFGGGRWAQINISEANTAFVFKDGGLYSSDMTRLVTVLHELGETFTVPDSVTTIDSSTFNNVRSLREVNLGRGFQGFTVHSAYFNGCSNLERITVPEENTALYSQDGVLFAYKNRMLLAYPEGKQDAVYEIPAGTRRLDIYAISGNSYLGELVIPNGVTNLSEGISYCENLKRVTIPASVRTIGANTLGYINGEKIEGFTIQGVVGSAAETYANENGFNFDPMEGPPANACGANLTWKVEDGVLTISGSGDMYGYDWGDAPWDDAEIHSIVLKEGITSIGEHAFTNIHFQDGPVELLLPDSLERIESDAFFSSGTFLLTIGKNLTSISEDSLGSAFWQTITVSEDNPAFVCENGVLYTRDKTRIVAVQCMLDEVLTLPESVVNIDRSAFANTFGLKTLVLNSSFLGFPTGAVGFSYCSNLESIVVPEDNPALCAKEGVLFSADGETLLCYPVAKQGAVYEIPEGTKSIGTYAMDDNVNLRKLVIPEGITDLGVNFRYCQNLKNVTVPASVTTIREETLGYCYRSLVSGFIIRGVPGSAAEAYANANGIKFVDSTTVQDDACGENLKWELEDGTLTISGTGDMWDFEMTDEIIGSTDHRRSVTTAPWGREDIQKLIIEDGVTSVGQYAFTDQLGLEEIRFPRTLKHIDAHAFENCGLFTVRLPEGLEKIGDQAFSISWMEKVYIPASLSEIGDSAFRSNNVIEFVIAAGNQSFCVKDGGLYSKDMTRLCAQNWTGSTVVIPDTVETVDVQVLENIMVDTLIIGAKCDLRSKMNAYTLGYAELKEIQVSAQNPYHLSKDGVLFSKDGTELSAYPKKKQGALYQVPEGVTTIRNYAIFNTIELKTVVLPETLQELPSYAITSERIKEIYVPASVTRMDGWCIGYYEDNTVSGFRIMGVPGSAAQTYAEENGFEFVPVTQTSFTVHYDANGGQNAPADQQRIQGTVMNLSEQVPTKAGYSFLGWDDDASAAMPRYKAGDPFAKNEDITLYAVWVQGDITNSGICGDQLVWYLDKEGTLTISGTGEMYDIPSVNLDGSSQEPWANMDFRKLVFSEGVTYISQTAFANCTQLRELAPLPSTLKRIGYSPFFGCTNLTGQLVLPEGLEVIHNFAFYNTGISGVLVLPDSLREIGACTFSRCNNLSTIYVGDNVQSIGAHSLGDSDTNVRWLYAGSQKQWQAIAEDGTEFPKGGIRYNAAKPLASESGQCGDNLIWAYENGTLTISGVGVMADYTEASPAPWDSYGMEICTVVVEAGCTAIGSRAFWDCARMTTLSLPEKLDAIGAGATLGCDSLTTVLYAGSKTSFERIRVGESNEAFKGAKLQLGDPTYKITYNNIATDDTNPNPGFGTNEQDVTLAAAQRRGYTFGGWYTDEALTQKVAKLSKTNQDDVELWAKWTPNSFTIEFKGNATGVTGTTAKVKGVTGVPITMPESTFQRKGYSFMYWTADSAGQGIAYNAGKELTFTVEKDGRILTAYAQWMANRYTMELDPNGGDGDMDSVDACYDESLTLPESEFQRIGYVFTGWNTKADGKGTTYKAGASVKNLAAEGSITLYAQWKPNTYTVHFDANGGAGTMKDQTLTYGKTAALTANAFKRVGYVFIGWRDAEGNFYPDKEPVTSLAPQGAVALTAQWEPITYTVKFRANGGDGTMDDLVLTYDQPVEQPALGFGQENFRFIGWATTANGKVVCQPEEVLNNLTATADATVTLYAKWTPYSYTVVYDANGGTGTMTNQTVLCGKDLTLTANAYSRTGYTFRGWSTKPSGQEVEYANKQAKLRLSEQDEAVVTLYAVWTPIEYKLTYKNTTGGETEYLPTTYTVETVGEVGQPVGRVGCIFEGWYLDSKYKQQFSGFVPGSYAKNLTLYAKWAGTAIRYNVHFDKGAEDATGTTKDMTNLVGGKEYTLTRNGFKRAGYTFTGWDMYANVYDDRAVFSNLTAYVPEAYDGCTIELTALWEPVTYELTYKNLTEEELGLVPWHFDVEWPALLPELTREGYDFGGWYLDSGFKKPVPDDTVSTPGNQTVYAKWTVHKYTVEFDSNAEDAAGTVRPLAMTYGTAKALTKNTFTRPGYTFLGWSENPYAAEPEYTNQEKVLNLTAEDGETVTLYALWEPTAYKLTYKNLTAEELEDVPEGYDVENPAELPELYREGYDFGWYLDSGCKNPVEDNTVAGTGNKTLYAKWTAHSYTVFFEGNGADNGTMEPVAMTYGTAKALTANRLTRTGYTFLGWSENSYAAEPEYTNRERVLNLTAEENGVITLYAVWTPAVYKLTYKNLTAEELEAVPASYDAANPAQLPKLTREGYDFEGWYLDSGFTKPVDSFAYPATGARTVYAKWTAHKYTVLFHINAGEDQNIQGAMKDMDMTYGTAKALTANAFVRMGYGFQGWATTPDAEYAEYRDKESVSNLTADDGGVVNLYAVWLLYKYAIVYKNITEAESYGLPGNYDITEDGELQAPAARPGCTFAGWYADSKCKSPFAFYAGTRTGKLTVYAKWEGTPQRYSIHFEKGAEDATGSMSNKTNLVCGKDYTLPKSGFKRPGYTLIGWTVEGDDSGFWWSDRGCVSDLPAYVSGDFQSGDTVTLTAVWTPTEYTLTYKNLTQEEQAELRRSFTVAWPAVLPELTREGYTLGGWYLDAGFKKPVEKNTVSTPGNKTVYAKWTANKYTVCFEGNGAARGSMKNQTMTYGAAKALTANSFSRPGYTFLGWSEDANATEATWKNQAKVRNLTAVDGTSVTLYAVWKAK